MGRRYLAAAAALLCSLGVTARAETRYLRGMLDDHLSAGAGSTAWTWHAASEDEERRMGLEPAQVTQAFAGECVLPNDLKRPVHGRIVELRNGQWRAFLDLNGDGAFSPDESAAFTAAPPGSHARAQAMLLAPLARGYYREMPVLLRLPETAGAVSSALGAQTVLILATPYVDGHVQTSSGAVLVRFSYDPVTGSLDAARTQQAMDLNRDGVIDDTPGSPELSATLGHAPIFHFKDQYLQTTRIDPETRTFTMKTLPASAYHRVAFGIGNKVPDFRFDALSGRRRQLADIKGKYRLLDFWATWSPASIANLAVLKAAYDRYHEQGFEILGMNGDADSSKAEALLARRALLWPQAKLDQEMIGERFAITAWPTEVLIDRQGKVVALISDKHSLESELERLLPH